MTQFTFFLISNGFYHLENFAEEEMFVQMFDIASNVHNMHCNNYEIIDEWDPGNTSADSAPPYLLVSRFEKSSHSLHYSSFSS